MIEINGKTYRNLQEQVEKNKEDIEELQSQPAVDAYTKSQSDAKYQTKSDMNNYYDKTASDDKYQTKTDMDNYYNKTASDDKFATKTNLTDGLSTKQDTLVSGTNIKTVNGNSLVGSGNVKIVGYEDIEVTVDEYSNGYITAEEYEKISVDHVPVYFAPTTAFPKTTTGSALTYLYAYEDTDYIYYKGTDRFVHAYETYVHNLLLPVIRFSKYIVSAGDTRHQVYYTYDNDNYIRYATADLVYSTNSWSVDDPYLDHVVIAGNRYRIDNTPEFGYISLQYGTTTVNLTLDQRNKLFNGKHGFMIGFWSKDPIDDHITYTYYYPISNWSINPQYINYTLSCGSATVNVEYDNGDETLTITY